MKSPYRNTGLSVAELIVAVSLFAIVLLSLGKVVSAGFENYWVSVGALDVQKAALFGTRRLTKELALSNIDAVETFSSPQGVVFASPHDSDGNTKYDSKGRILWQSHVGYYIKKVSGVSALCRNQVPANTLSNAPALPSAEGHSTGFLSARSGESVVASGVTDLKAVVEEDIVHLTVTGVFEQRGVFSIEIQNQIAPRN